MKNVLVLFSILVFSCCTPSIKKNTYYVEYATKAPRFGLRAIDTVERNMRDTIYAKTDTEAHLEAIRYIRIMNHDAETENRKRKTFLLPFVVGYRIQDINFNPVPDPVSQRMKDSVKFDTDNFMNRLDSEQNAKDAIDTFNSI